jgi:hypothetical protein
MATKKSVFLSGHTVSWIESTTSVNTKEAEEGPRWSEAINATFEQFRFLLREALPELDADEWETILNVYAGIYFPAHGVPARIASDMMDNLGEISVENVEAVNPGYAALVKKVHAMPQAQQLAILYFVQIFWSSDWRGEWDEIVEEIKNKF